MADLLGVMKSFWLVWCALLFAGIVARVYWPGRRGELEEHGQIPFADEGER